MRFLKTTIFPNDLEPTEFQPYFRSYIELAGDTDALESLEQQIEEFNDLLQSIDNDTALTVHPPYQWNIKQVVGHIIDVEKVFGGRAHRIACGENQALPGFDQDLFVANSDYDHVSLNDLAAEFESTRKSNFLMFARWTDEMWARSGNCDGKNISVRAIACLLVGHVNHHLIIVRKRLGM